MTAINTHHLHSVVSHLATNAEPPLTPSADEARRMLRSELSNPVYSSGGTSLFGRLLEKLKEILEQLMGTTMPSSSVWWVLVAAAAAVVIAVILAGPVRRRVKSKSTTTAFVDSSVSAQEYHDKALAAAAAGDLPLACAQLFRASVRRSEEDVIIDDIPGRTAYEAALSIGARISELASELRWGAAVFDLVEYGEGEATTQDVARLEALYQAISRAQAQVRDSSLSNSAVAV